MKTNRIRQNLTAKVSAEHAKLEAQKTPQPQAAPAQPVPASSEELLAARVAAAGRELFELHTELDEIAAESAALTHLLISHEEKEVLSRKDGGVGGIEMTEFEIVGLVCLQSRVGSALNQCTTRIHELSLELRGLSGGKAVAS